MPTGRDEEPDDIDRLNQAFVRGEIGLNEYIRKLESLENLAATPKEEH